MCFMIINDIKELRAFAKSKHDQVKQTYGTGKSYSVHLDMVREIIDLFMDDSLSKHDYEILIRAVFGHDLIEDTGMSYNKVESKFGTDEADVIFSVTDESGKNRIERMFKTLPKTRDSRLGTFLKMCDRYANGSNSKAEGHRLYSQYRREYPVFRFALKRGNQFAKAWKMLDELFEYKEIA